MDFQTEIQKLVDGDDKEDIYSDEHYIPEEVELALVPVPTKQTTEFDDQEDYQIARSVHHNLILKGNSALEVALKTFANTESPAVLREITALIKVSSGLSSELLKLQELSASKPAKVISDDGTPINNDVDVAPKNMNTAIEGFFTRKNQK